MSKVAHILNIKNLVLKKPRVTEKATVLASGAKPVYTFEVPLNVNKHQIKKAITEQFKVTPVKINIVNLPAKRVQVRRTDGMRSAVKKALVFLKSGQSIDVV